MAKVRVWAYKDGVLLLDGFESESKLDRPEADDSAIVPCLIALLEGFGCAVCIGTSAEGEWNEEVRAWEDVTETEGGRG